MHRLQTKKILNATAPSSKKLAGAVMMSLCFKLSPATKWICSISLTSQQQADAEVTCDWREFSRIVA